MYLPQDIAGRIKARAKALRKPVSAVLSDCELNHNALTAMAKGVGLQSISLAKIADVLDCSVDFLLGRIPFPEIGKTDLSDDEQEIISAYRQLNKNGQSWLRNAAKMTAENDEYKKIDTNNMVG